MYSSSRLFAPCCLSYWLTVAKLCLIGLFPEGPPQFKTAAELEEALPRAKASPKQAVPSIPFPESYSDARRRCATTVTALAERHPHDSILLVGHGLSVEYLVSA